MPLLITSAAEVDGGGYSALLAFDLDGQLLGSFCNDSRIADPPALVGAATAAYFVPLETAKRAWASWVVILPVGALVILAYSLKTWFVR